MVKELQPQDTARAAAYALWMKAPNPMVSFFKTLDVTNLVRIGRRRGLKFHMLMAWCVGKAAASIPEFYMLPVGEKLLQFDALAVSTIVKNRAGGLSSCDVRFTEDRARFERDYLAGTAAAAEECRDRDLSDVCMVIGTSSVLETELDGVVGMYSGLFHNPFLFWGRYRKKLLRCLLPVSFQFHHTQMDGAQAGRFLENLQEEIRRLR